MIKIWRSKKYSILKNLLVFSSVFVIIATTSIPVFVRAKGGTGDGGGTGGNAGSGVEINTKINNPLGSDLDTIPKFIQALIKVVLYVGVPIVALAIIYTGFLFVSAQGNSEKITKAKKALTYTLIGAALLLGAFVIANALVSTFKEISG